MSAVKQKTNKDPLDRYYTPEWVTQLLVEDWPFPDSIRTVWEPCCGEMHMANVIRFETTGNVSAVFASDVHSFDGGQTFDFLRDGLEYGTHPRLLLKSISVGSLAIATNPPYSIPGATAADFVRKALEYTPYVAMLLRLSWADGCAERSDIFSERPPAEIRVIRPRVHFTGPNESETKAPNGASAWFIWKPGSEGTVMSWIGGEVQS